MNRVLVLFIIAAIIITGFLAYNNLIKKQVYMPQDNKKAVIIISFRNFRDGEYFIPKEILEKAGVEIKTASNKTGLAIGSDGGEVNIDLLVSDINIGEFDAVVFIGGPGCLISLDNEQSYNIAREAVSQNKLLASICISPVILAKAGVLEGKKATVWSSSMDKSPVKALEEKGVLYQAEPVIVDGKIITANGPAAAKGFGQAIVEGLTKSY